ncbi:MAG: alkaline phosphatase family protein [Myxococcota bacterium]
MLKRWFLLFLLAATSAWGKPPRLTVFIAVDAMGTDVLLRNRGRFKAGLSQLLTQGAFFPSTRYEYPETVTAAGHATLSTGAYPWRHGVVSNQYFNRASGKEERIFSDANHPVLEAPLSSDDVSPENLLAETLSDRLRLATQGRGKSVAISTKARAAIALAGKLGQAWWFHEGVGKFVTGTWYAKEFPAWVKGFNDKKLPDAYFSKEWTLAAPVKDYVGQDDRPFESDWYGLGRVFPHPLKGGLPGPGPQSYSALRSSPMMNDLLVQLSKVAIEHEGLGKDEVPDLLSVSFSAIDKVGHLYGPYSWEMQDALIRLDKSIAELLAAADKAAGGRANLLVVVSADHGGAAVPEEWTAAGLDGRRLHPDAVKKELNKELASRFGPGDYVASIEEVDIYLSSKTLADKKLDAPLVRRAAAAFLARHGNIAYAVARDDLYGADTSPSYLRGMRLGFHPDRSGDVLFVTRPFHVLTEETTGTSHGTPYSYDAQVPLILAGKGVKPGLYRQEIAVVDVAPTVASILEIGCPASSEGTVRAEALTGK